MKNKKNKYFNKVGGMALMDGVMMKSKNKIATANRNPKTLDIEVHETPLDEDKYKLIKKIPILRGVFAFIESMFTGINEITKSAQNIDLEDDEEITDKDIAISVVISLVLAIVIFTVIPNLITNWIFPIKNIKNKAYYVFTESTLKLGIFIIYILLVSRMEEIKTVFKYHGAEHKSIACLESKGKVDAKAAKKCTRFHPRCGTSFIVLVLIISIIVSYFINTNVFWLRVLYKLLLLPVIAGISYEFIHLSNKYDNIFTSIIKFPGLMLQRITTKEPEEEHLECAIAALYAALSEYNYITIKEAIIKYVKEYKIESSEALRIIAKYLEKDKNKLYIDMDSIYLDYKDYINIKNRVKKYKVDNIPLQYILNSQDFYGLEMYVEEGVLVPRADTEILVEEAINAINKNKYKTGIDMCCGSGCIGIAVSKNSSLEKVYSADISEKAEKVTKINIDKNKATNIEFIRSDLFKNLKNKKVDIIMSNPPYIESSEILKLDKVVQNEPHLALDGGNSGLEFYEKIAKDARKHLNDNGTLIFEIGYKQGNKVKNILKKYEEYSNIKVIKDLAKNERVVICHFHKI